MNDKEGGWKRPEKDMEGGRGFVPGRRADADSVVEEDRVTLLDSILDEVVLLRGFGRVPVATGGGFAVREEVCLKMNDQITNIHTACHIPGHV